MKYKWEHSRHPIGKGYSGAPEAINNPHMEGVPFVGPIPRGRYRLGPMYHHKSKGPHVMNLEPIDHDAHHRTELRVHGDNEQMNQSASEGYLILPREIRLRMGHSHDRVLRVL